MRAIIAIKQKDIIYSVITGVTRDLSSILGDISNMEWKMLKTSFNTAIDRPQFSYFSPFYFNRQFNLFQPIFPEIYEHIKDTVTFLELQKNPSLYKSIC